MASVGESISELVGISHRVTIAYGKRRVEMTVGQRGNSMQQLCPSGIPQIADPFLSLTI